MKTPEKILAEIDRYEAMCVQLEEDIAKDKREWNVLNHEKMQIDIDKYNAKKLALEWVMDI